MARTRTLRAILVSGLIATGLVPATAEAQAAPDKPVAVTADNFVRAETDLYFAGIVKDGGLGKCVHHRELTGIDNQAVIRMNRDTLYSAAVLDLDAGPATITLPDAGRRFMSMQVIDEDHFTPQVVYGAGTYTLDKAKIGTRYAAVAVRTLVDPANPQDVQQIHALQDAIKVSSASMMPGATTGRTRPMPIC